MELLSTIITALQEFFNHFGITLKAEMRLLDLISLIAIPFSLLYLPYKYIYTHITSTQANRESVLPWLENQGYAQKYKTTVARFSNALTSFYGASNSAQSFARSWAIAMVYPILFFFLSYIFFSGSPEFAGMTLLPQPGENRLILFWIIISMLVIIFGMQHVGTAWFDSFMQTRIIRLLLDMNKSICIPYKVSRGFLLVFLIGSCTGLILVAIGSIVETRMLMSMHTFILLRTITIIFVVAFVLANFHLFVGIGAIVAAFYFNSGFGVILLSSDYTALYFVFMFIVILPLVNAFFDWLSLRISRYFLKVVGIEDSPWLLLADILIDLALAIILMLAFIIVVTATTEFINNLYGTISEKAVVDWHYNIQSALDDPFGKGIMITAMITSTLLPTLLHMFIGLFAFILNSLFGKHLALYLRSVGNASRKASFAAIWIEIYLIFVLCFMISCYYSFQLLFNLPFGQWLFFVAEWGHNKPIVVISVLLIIFVLVLTFPLNPSLKKTTHI